MCVSMRERERVLYTIGVENDLLDRENLYAFIIMSQLSQRLHDMEKILSPIFHAKINGA